MTERASVNDQVPHVGVSAYFPRAVWDSPGGAQRIAGLLVDPRWPWIPWWTSYSGKHKRDDRKPVRVGGKHGVGPILEGLASDKLRVLDMNRARGEGNFTSVMLHLDRAWQTWEYPFDLLLTCRAVELPAGRSMEAWIGLVHELLTALEAQHATMGVWPTYTMARCDTWLTRMVLDTPQRDINLGLPERFSDQISLVSQWWKFLGRTYARHPRWGTYLNDGHLAAIGGIERVRAEVAPARVERVGELTYLQLTESIETALTAEAGARRERLEALMAPILVGAPRPADAG